MNECQLRIINRTRLLQMLLAAAMTVVGTALIDMQEQYLKMAGIVLLIAGWGTVIFSFYQTIPEKAKYFIPAIIAIVVSSLMLKFTKLPKQPFWAMYAIGWGVFGWVISQHIDGSDRWLGPSAAIMAVASLGMLIYHQGMGMVLYTAAWGLVSVVHAYPTIAGIKSSGPACAQFIGNKIPEMKPYIDELECVMKSGCFDKISKIEPVETPEYLAQVVQAVACAGEHCSKFKTISKEIECATTKCLPEILKQKPDSPLKWMTLLLQEYPKCKSTCLK